VAAVVLVAAGLLFSLTNLWGAVTDWWSGAPARADQGGKGKKGKKAIPAELVYFGKNQGLRLSQEAMTALQVAPEEVKRAAERRPLPPQIGTINYDPDRLFTIRSRFAGEIAEMHKVLDTDTISAETKLRPIRFGDKVPQDKLLAVVWSKDLGAAKAALVDAITNVRLSQDRLDRQAKTFAEGALSRASYLEAERQLRLDRNAELTAERTLRMWKLGDDEIRKIREEANSIHDEKKVRSAVEETKWARVEIRTPKYAYVYNARGEKELDPDVKLTVVEKNTNVIDMVDPINSPPLFKLADLGRLQIWVHPPEEYLPLLREQLQKGGPDRPTWKIRFQADPPETPALELPILQIAPSLEPNQHTPMVVGYLDNKDHKYLIGQFVTAEISVAAEKNTVAIPTNALNDVEGQSLVFVEKDREKRTFELRRVAVWRRFKDVTYVRTVLTPDEQRASEEEVKRGRRPLQTLQAGERVVTRGVVEMTAALESLASQAQASGKAPPAH
jgi:cobalt-zinc-cadmium efflux system membrane fusion protein